MHFKHVTSTIRCFIKQTVLSFANIIMIIPTKTFLLAGYQWDDTEHLHSPWCQHRSFKPVNWVGLHSRGFQGISTLSHWLFCPQLHSVFALRFFIPATCTLSNVIKWHPKYQSKRYEYPKKEVQLKDMSALKR